MLTTQIRKRKMRLWEILNLINETVPLRMSYDKTVAVPISDLNFNVKKRGPGLLIQGCKALLC